MSVPYRVLFSNDTINILTCKSPYNERAGLGLDPATGKPTYHPCGFCVANGGVLPAYGFVTRHVAELRMENVRVVPASGDPRPFHASIACHVLI